jgi:hypothetical protein
MIAYSALPSYAPTQAYHHRRAPSPPLHNIEKAKTVLQQCQKNPRQKHLQTCVNPLKKTKCNRKIEHTPSPIESVSTLTRRISTRPPAQTSDQMAHSLRRYYPDQVLRDSLSLNGSTSHETQEHSLGEAECVAETEI